MGSAWSKARLVEKFLEVCEKGVCDRRHLVVAMAVCCREAAGSLVSLWRLLAARREAMIVWIADEALYLQSNA